MTTTDDTSKAPTPEAFLREASTAQEGWSQAYGGPLGVAKYCADLQAQLARQSEQIAAIRVAAIRQMLTTNTGVAVARDLGVSKAAISKSLKTSPWENSTW